MSNNILKNYIKQIIKENKEFITSLHVYDFDSTLFDSPAVNAIKEEENKKFDYKSSEMLDKDHVEEKYQINLHDFWIESVVEEARKSISNPTTLTAMCTARSAYGDIKYFTMNLLSEKNLNFDRFFFKPLKSHFSSTAEYKSSYIEMLLNAYPNIKEIIFYDDDHRNLLSVEKLADARGIRYIPIDPQSRF